MVLGNMDVGLNAQNLVAIVTIWLLTLVNVFGVKTGAMVQNVFTITKALSLALFVVVGFAIAARVPRRGLRLAGKPEQSPG